MSDSADDANEPGWVGPDVSWPDAPGASDVSSPATTRATNLSSPATPSAAGTADPAGSSDRGAAPPSEGTDPPDVWAAYGDAASDNPTAPIPGDPLGNWIGLTSSDEISAPAESPEGSPTGSPDNPGAVSAPGTPDPMLGIASGAPIDGAGRRRSTTAAGAGGAWSGSGGAGSGWGSPGGLVTHTVVVPAGLPVPPMPAGAPTAARKPPTPKATGKPAATAPKAEAPPKPSNAPPPPPPPRRRIAPWVGGIIAPVVVFMIGTSLVLSAVGGDGSSDRSSTPRRTDASRASLVPATGSGGASLAPAAPGTDDTAPVTPAPPVIVIPSIADPDGRAEAIVRTYLTSLANDDLVTARAMTDVDIDEKAIKNLDSAQAIIVRSSQIGPDLMSVRLVIAEYRTTKDGPTTGFRCADWDVDTAVGRIAERASGELRPTTAGVIKPGDLATTLGAECEGATLKK